MKTNIKKFIKSFESFKPKKKIPKLKIDKKVLTRFPIRIRRGLETFAETNDILYSAEIAGVPYIVFNSYRIKAGLKWLI